MVEYVYFTVTYTQHHSEAPEPPRPFLHLRRHDVANNSNEREEVGRPHAPVARRARGPEVLDAGAGIMPLVSHFLICRPYVHDVEKHVVYNVVAVRSGRHG